MSIFLIGHDNFLPLHHVVYITDTRSNSSRKLSSRKGAERKIIDAAKQKKKKSLILTDDAYLIVSSITPQGLHKRFKEKGGSPLKGVISIGHGNFVPISKIVSIQNINSEPIKEFIKQKNLLDLFISSTNGRKTKSIILTSNHYCIASSLKTITLKNRINQFSSSSLMVDVGHENYVNRSLIESILDSDTRPVKTLISKSKESHHFINLTMGRKTRALLIAENGLLISSSVLPETIVQKGFEKGGSDEL
ncbi:DUF370 domain-containing protein (plasmid) [Pontibacillus sp. ALD_SL1]|uniref:extracellular matrix/biofilm biosynthesis regulator RemA family protein n=1 Tax=Pontibacillus sp. ALD_SL1 TaxID=2777185 RepID=UPI001A963633|nr:extracellular matrix/biofilm biosynthesis regulator RemA family protein [Pontibacillus sp. ALD_SL1]QST02346.1 DUF370 domain-containing protein [Pontibacillus sp. ALD_SL1]